MGTLLIGWLIGCMITAAITSRVVGDDTGAIVWALLSIAAAILVVGL